MGEKIPSSSIQFNTEHIKTALKSDEITPEKNLPLAQVSYAQTASSKYTFRSHKFVEVIPRIRQNKQYPTQLTPLCQSIL